MFSVMKIFREALAGVRMKPSTLTLQVPDFITEISV